MIPRLCVRSAYMKPTQSSFVGGNKEESPQRATIQLRDRAPSNFRHSAGIESLYQRANLLLCSMIVRPDWKVTIDLVILIPQIIDETGFGGIDRVGTG